MKRGQIRIIGGQWRGRRCPVPEVAGLRPTPDRVRETLFNWLNLRMAGARCLDAFAGTGALGFEAASRGAAEVVMTEVSPVALRHLTAQVTAFAADTVTVMRGAQPAVLNKIPGVFDIVFLDPPWQAIGLLAQTVTALVDQAKLAPEARIYLETPKAVEASQLPLGWRILREVRAGDVYATLVAAE